MWRTLVFWLALLAVAGCARTTRAVRVATHSTLTLVDKAPDPQMVEKHCPFGMPIKLDSLEHGPTTLIGRDAYVLEHDGASKIALWVCASLDPALVFGPAKRKDNWKPEPDLDGRPRAVDADYKGSGWSRGHMTASEDRVATQVLNDMTFFFSNAVPQNGSLNSGQWNQLEGRIRDLLEHKKIKNARMITGGFFYDPDEDNPGTADGMIVFQQIGAGLVAVPTHVYKIVVAQNADDEWRAIAFFADNKKPPAGWKFTDGIVAIDWLEERTGLNFMPDATPQEEAALESKPSPMWQ
jgi:DNA/RNA endonuclease G (NUC1)